jgi:hypothetical protein
VSPPTGFDEEHVDADRHVLHTPLERRHAQVEATEGEGQAQGNGDHPPLMGRVCASRTARAGGRLLTVYA